MVKLIDFGYSLRIGDQKDVCNRIIGTSYYIAPEMLQGKGYGKTCDIWSAGVSLFVMLSGSLPFDHEDDMEVL